MRRRVGTQIVHPARIDVGAGPRHHESHADLAEPFVRDPDDRVRKAEITRGALSFGQTDAVGVYTLTTGNREVRFAVNLVDATECARGHIQALEKGRSGERYILGGENLTLKQILDRLAAITGLKSPTLKLPYVFAFATGAVDEMVTGRLLGREPRATIDAVRMGRKMMFVSSAKAERELGWRRVSVDGALRRSVDWFRGNGYV